MKNSDNCEYKPEKSAFMNFLSCNKCLIVSILMLIMFIIMSVTGKSEILTRPYLQAANGSNIVILVETDSKSPIEAEYGVNKKADKKAKSKNYIETSTANIKKTYVHRIKLQGLEQGRKYYYSVKEGDKIYNGEFITAKKQGEKIKFAVQGDNRSQPKIFAKVLKGMESHNPEFALFSGDIAFDSKYTTWKKEFFINELLDFAANVPFYNSVGNHEGWNQNTEAFTHAPDSKSGKQDYYSFDYGDVHVLVLNTQASLSKSAGQVKFAENDLKNSTAKWKIVVYHIPAYCAGGHGESKTMKRITSEIFEKYGVDIVINGHSHFYQRNFINGIYHLIVAGGGASLYTPKEKDYVQKSEKKHHYAIFEVEDNKLKMLVYDLNGAILDNLELTK